ncbi:MAPEG family protein [Ferrimonas sediminum]|uniref:MAPEG family protein n=1 Tax=Ferrimonas sediminum TaxID=718193 RepID=A0A1G8VMH7_9GAMM|nr:MAPEG family protein [Ferrimonas sediminum]SDJ67179.1 MAPEG family protein [Ferrimonas sediminum]
MFDHYLYAQAGLLLMLATMFAQTTIAIVAHRRQSNCIPGVVADSLGHESFVFRSHRTYQNSLENVPMMAATVLLAMFMGLDAETLAILVWIYALARLVHMALYYAIATEKNPSPRSYFFIIGFITNLVLLVMIALHLQQ